MKVHLRHHILDDCLCALWIAVAAFLAGVVITRIIVPIVASRFAVDTWIGF